MDEYILRQFFLSRLQQHSMLVLSYIEASVIMLTHQHLLSVMLAHAITLDDVYFHSHLSRDRQKRNKGHTHDVNLPNLNTKRNLHRIKYEFILLLLLLFLNRREYKINNLKKDNSI
jgi:hypothetical protein